MPRARTATSCRSTMPAMGRSAVGGPGSRPGISLPSPAVAGGLLEDVAHQVVNFFKETLAVAELSESS